MSHKTSSSSDFHYWVKYLLNVMAAVWWPTPALQFCTHQRHPPGTGDSLEICQKPWHQPVNLIFWELILHVHLMYKELLQQKPSDQRTNLIYGNKKRTFGPMLLKKEKVNITDRKLLITWYYVIIYWGHFQQIILFHFIWYFIIIWLCHCLSVESSSRGPSRKPDPSDSVSKSYFFIYFKP